MSKGEIIGLKDIPYALRANDFQRHVLNIDSRFRQQPTTTSSSDFVFVLPTTIRNVLRVRLTSIEFPNNYYQFTADRKNTTLLIKDSMGVTHTVTIPDGNYSACEMQDELNAQIDISGLEVTFNSIRGHFVFTGTSQFTIDTASNAINRDFDYGLGYYLGFRRGVYPADGSGSLWTLESDCAANFSGDSYLLLNINDWRCVAHNFQGNSINVFAKIIINEAKNYMTFDDYAGHHIKEVVFAGPEDIKRIHIQILDAYGKVVDLPCVNFSFSLEVLEVMNVKLFDAIRNSLATPYMLTDPGRSGGPPEL
jgi:hypothetical protein